jgi:hypothetical protein
LKEFTVTITEDHQIKGEGLLLKAYRNLKPGTYKNQLTSLNRRSLNQNAYIHVVFTLCQKGLLDGGYSEIRTMQDAKDFYKKLFLKPIECVNEQTGEVYEVDQRTSTLTKEEMAVFIQQVLDHQLEWFGNYIPDSNEWKNNINKYDLVGLSV